MSPLGLLDRVDAMRRSQHRFSIDEWISDYLQPTWSLGGHSYPLGLTQTLAGNRVQEVATTLPGYSQALKASPPAFAAEMVRSLILSQARLVFRNLPGHPTTPRRQWSSSALAILEQPWPNATSGELLARMEWCAGLAGNAYVVRQGSRLRVLRPDWVTLIYGSEQDPDDAAHALDGRLIGYAYQVGGRGPDRRTITLLPSEVAHWAPIPDPEAVGIGMSWITPAIRDIQGDRAATTHKLRFFEQGATPNMVVKGIGAGTKAQFDEIVESLEAKHSGVANAYRTLYLTAGADVSVVGSDLRQLDFGATQGRGETRIAFLSRVPAPLLGISEGLAGSSLNAGNFGMARRIFADSWVYPTLQDLAASLSSLVSVPADSELWFDVADMPILREDARDAAEIERVKAQTITALVKEGFTAASSVAAVQGQNMNLLQHTGLVSVQLQPPGTTPAEPALSGTNGNGSRATVEQLSR